MAAPLRLRLTMIAAIVLTSRVIRKSTKPAVSRADNWLAVASPNLPAISEETVKRHLSNIFDKTGVSTRLELALFAIAHKLVMLDN